MSQQRATASAWKRNLYEKHPYKDTYYDGSTFLDSLTIVSNYHSELKVWDWNCCSFSIQVVSVPILIMTVHFMLKFGNISSEKLFLCELLFSVCCWAGFMVIRMKTCRIMDLETLKVWGLFLVCFRIAAPAFQTLTLSFSDNTIFAVIMALFGIHMVAKSVVNHLSGTISLSASMFAVLILASRQNNPNCIVVFLLLSIMLLVYLPLLLEYIAVHSALVMYIYAFLLLLVTTCTLYYLDGRLTGFYLFVIMLCSFVGPRFYSVMVREKQAWKGPWDTAEVGS